MSTISIDSISFIYEGSKKPVIDNLTTAFGSGWTGIVGPNGCGKSTLMKILNGKLAPTTGSISGFRGTSELCSQETSERPEGLEDFVNSYDKEVLRLKGSLGLYEIEGRDWSYLSHGERKRMQLGMALSKQPDLLMLDEPTNHLDAKNREFIIETLKQYRGIGILVSHDRELLDALATQCVMYRQGSVFTIAGNYTEAEKSVAEELKSRANRSQSLQKAANSLEKEVSKLERDAALSKQRLSKRNVKKKDSDARAKLNLAKLTNKDSSNTQKKNNLENRLSKVNEEIDSLRPSKSYADSIFFSEKKRHKKLLMFERDQTIELPGVNIKLPELVIETGDKIGITGVNGAGKSSLIRWILGEQKLKNCEHFFLKQELSAEEKKELKQQLKALPKEKYPRCFQIIARLGSDAKQVIKSDNLSSGEIRKVAIALAIVNEVDLIILDEPTNHLDLHSVQNLEVALASCNLAVLLVSHDKYFLDAVCSKKWHLEKSESETSLEVLYS